MLLEPTRTVALVAAALLAALACGRTPTPAAVGKDGGAAPSVSAPGTGGAPGSGGRSGRGGSGGLGGIPDLGTETLDWFASTGGAAGSCETVPEVPEEAEPVCAFTGSRGASYGCEDVPAKVLVDSTSFYFQLDWNHSIVRCPVGTSSSRIFKEDSYGLSSSAYGTVYGQMLANGLVRFLCAVRESAGPGWNYRYTCSASGVQTIETDPKSGAIFVHIPVASGDGASTLYGGHPEVRCEPPCAPRSVTFYRWGDEAETPVWTSPLDFSADGRTFWFDDRDGGRVAMRVNERLEVVDIRRW